MKTFYFTFMMSQFALKDYYVKVNAMDLFHARQVMHENFGDKWAFCYDEKPIDELAINGCLMEINAINGKSK